MLLIIAVILVTLLALLLGVSGMDKESPKSIAGFRSFIVLTDSMNPTFDAGSIIIIRETAAANLQIGDIITYRPARSDDVLLTHRIVSINGAGADMIITTRGDANNTDDNPVSPGAILGKTVFFRNGLGTFIINLRTPKGILGMVAVIGIGLFLIPYLLSLGDKPKKPRKAGILYDEDDGIDKDEDEYKDEDDLDSDDDGDSDENGNPDD